MAHIATRNSPKPCAVDYLLLYGHSTSLRYIGVVLSRQPTIPIGNYSIHRSRIWTGSYIPLKTFGWHCHLLETLPYRTLGQSNLPLVHQSPQQTSLLHETLHTCPTHLQHQLHQSEISQIHVPIYDPERSINLLPTWYTTLRDHFFGSSLEIILHDRVYVSIASISSIDINAD